MSALADNRQVFLATGAASRRDIALAVGAVVFSSVLFLAAAPFAARPLPQVSAFIPAYESALVVGDLITAVFLFSQYSLLRSRAVLVLACGYLFTTVVAFAHELSFPGVFAPAGLLGAGPQTTTWLYLCWHAGLPVSIILYAWLRDRGADARGLGAAGVASAGGAGARIAVSGAATLVLAGGFILAATVFEGALPVLIGAGAYMTQMVVCVVCVLALILVWRRDHHTVLDICMIVVMCAYLFDIALCGILNAGSYDLGWYSGRLYSLLAGSALLIVLMSESARNHGQLAQLSDQLAVANAELETLSFQDGLTTLANRRYFDTYLHGQISLARRRKRDLALVLCDVDAFKAYNDQYGHQAGDACLKQIAAALKSCCRRPTDMAARYGGEEFALILPETDLAGAEEIAEAARAAVAHLRLPHAQSPTAPYVTISGGVFVLMRGSGLGAAEIIAAADAMLFRAKNEGRDRIVCVEPELRLEQA
jgi:diguanylate cyclase (GGDEF)-like protein